MSWQQMVPQEQEPKRPLSIWLQVRTGIFSTLATLWRLLFWIWSILIAGAIAGVLGNALFTLLTTGKIDVTGTVLVLIWLYAHFSLCIVILTPILVITLCSYLAHRWKQHIAQENQRAHDKSLTVIAQGVQRALDELNAKPATPPSLPPSVPVSENTTPPKVIWNIPFRRNSYFTGREDLLKHLHDRLTRTKAALTQPQAISGLGGIGKTQTAVEYAYRYQEGYQAVLWVHAAARDTIITSFVELAALLTLPEQQEQDQQKVIAAVKRWFVTHDHWLLIFDNADDLDLVEAFLPAGGKGHLLLTTREQAHGTLAHGIKVEVMDLEESMLLLLRRAKVLAPEGPLDQASATDRALAETIAREMDGLPLALDQAGAYIEETHCSLSSYQEQYRQHQSRLLKRRGGSGKDHPEPVATTWSLSFEHVEHLNATAADLLRCCAFLAPDAIPEQLIVEGASELGPHLQTIVADASLLDEAMSILLCYSLVQRKRDEHTITIHRLVQAVLRNTMDAVTQRTWAERTVRAINQTFPDVTDYRNWSHSQQYLPHAQACVRLMDQWELMFPETGALLNSVGYYLDKRAQYAEAEPLFQRAVAIGEKMLGPEHPDLATRLNNLALLYAGQGKYGQAEPLFQRAIAIDEKVLGPEHPGLATDLNNLANLYQRQGKYEQAEPLFQRAITIGEKMLGPEHPGLATDLNNLATWLNNLALLYQRRGKYEQAEPLYQRAIAIGEQVHGPQHPDLATWLNNLAILYRAQGKYEQAEPLYQRALAIYKKTFGPHHPDTKSIQENYARLLEEKQRKRR